MTNHDLYCQCLAYSPLFLAPAEGLKTHQAPYQFTMDKLIRLFDYAHNSMMRMREMQKKEDEEKIIDILEKVVPFLKMLQLLLPVEEFRESQSGYLFI